jgi:glucosylceramidase
VAGLGSGGVQGSGGSGSGGSGGTPVVVERPSLVTSGPGSYWQVGTLTPVAGTATVTVDPASNLQQWIGFGGTFNEAGWDALSELPQAERDRAIALLFSPSEGANFAWGRIPIGASDYAIDRYTLCDTQSPDMSAFSIARDQQRLIPYIKAAQAVKGDIRFWASPWSPPAWMKTPQQIDGTDEAASYRAEMNPTYLAAHALYFVRFIQAYAEQGIPIDHVQPQNEPGYATRYPSCLWDPGLLGTFVGEHLGPALQDNGLSTGIWFGTLSNNDEYPNHIGGVLGPNPNAAALGFLTGVGLQWNTMGRIAMLRNDAPNLLIMQTEHRCGNYPFSVPGTPAFNPDMPPNDHAYAVESWGYIRDWINAGVNAYSAWNMVLDTIGKNLDLQRPWPQNALLVVDRATDQLITTPVYYVFRHLSYFVDPGATRIATTGGDALAFRNPDGALVTVLYNSGGQAADTTVALGATTFQVQVPSQGWATLYWQG